jgi:hypothetical protein
MQVFNNFSQYFFVKQQTFVFAAFIIFPIADFDVRAPWIIEYKPKYISEIT